MAKENVIKANDCCPFDCDETSKKDFRKNENWQKLLVSFSDSFLSDSQSVFHFLANKRNKEDDMPFAQLLRDRDNKLKWFAGRWVGSVKTENCIIRVSPRFGNLALFSLIEEIFSINILDNLSDKANADLETLMEQLVPFIWAKKLGEANRYGIPHTTVDIRHKGVTVKGRLLVRQSFLPFFKQKNVVLATREKRVDATICRIILQSYKFLNAKRSFPITKMTESAQNAIISFENANVAGYRVTPKEYEDIRYKSIYESWKDIVDLSWQIIQHHHFSQKESDIKQGFGLFVDMAEIWELFLRHILKKCFPDWTVESPEESVYTGLFYNRSIIPDILMRRGNDVMVFDAKWKKMECDFKDLDRSDFFQIHTYIQYYQKMGYKVIAGGLLYPISLEEEVFRQKKRQAGSLFGMSNDNTSFIVDGICFGKEYSLEYNYKEEIEEARIEEYRKQFDNGVKSFIGRINSLIGT
jgi:5-methylcytosine-specific restriction endonuclease McrBC regulatory subunit McrC